jgi:hypothetical protein
VFPVGKSLVQPEQARDAVGHVDGDGRAIHEGRRVHYRHPAG